MELSKRQIEIIEAATKLIGDKGIQNLTTKNLASEMKFSEPALYRHFKGKTKILESVLIYYKEKLRGGLGKVVQSEVSDIEKIQKMIDFQFAHFTRFPAVIMVIFSETSFQYDNLLSNVVSKIMNQKRQAVNKIIESGQEKGCIRDDVDADQLTTVVMGSMRLTVLRWKLSNFDFNLVEEGKVLWNTIELLIKKE